MPVMTASYNVYTLHRLMPVCLFTAEAYVQEHRQVAHHNVALP